MHKKFNDVLSFKYLDVRTIISENINNKVFSNFLKFRRFASSDQFY